MDWAATRRAGRDLPVGWPGVRLGGPSDVPGGPAADLGSAHPGEQQCAMQAVRDGVAFALALGCSRLVLEIGVVAVVGDTGPTDLGDPGISWTKDAASAQRSRTRPGRDAALTRVCRAFHGLCGEFPDVEFAVTPSRHVHSLAHPGALQDLFEDLPGRRLRYWHDTALAARWGNLLDIEQGGWLENLSKYISGITLGDVGDDALYMPPGTGGVDWPLVAAYVSRTREAHPTVLELDPSVESSDLPGVRAFLDKFGL